MAAFSPSSAARSRARPVSIVPVAAPGDAGLGPLERPYRRPVIQQHGAENGHEDQHDRELE